jgi:hypothetical protein
MDNVEEVVDFEVTSVDTTKSENKLTDWKNEPTISDLKQNIDDAENDQDIHRQNVDRWLKNRAATPTKPKDKNSHNRSTIIPKVIRKQAEWRYSSLADPFLSTPDLFNVYPKTAGDVNRARQNQLILNTQFNTQIKKVKFIDDYVRDAVDTGTSIVRVGWISEEAEVTETIPTYEYMPDETGQLAQQYDVLLQIRQKSADEYADYSNPGIDHALEVYRETGVALFARELGKKTVTKVKEVKNQPTVEVVPSENIIIDPSCGGDIDKAVFIGEKFKSSIAELKRDGRYTNLDKIDVKTTDDPKTSTDFEESSPDVQSFTFKDNTRKKFVVFNYWGEWDINGDGTTQQIVCTWVNDVIIQLKLNPFPDKKPPFVQAVYMPVRESVFGEPDGALLKDNQDIIGAVTRGAIDLLGKSANSQTGMRKDMLDVTNQRRFKKGLDYEFNDVADPRQGIYQHTFPEIPQSVFNMLTMQNAEAESLTGVKAFNSGISGNSLGSVATGVRGALDAASKRELGILRRLAQGVIEIGRKIIAMNAEFLSEEEVVRVTDTMFIPVRRDDLAGNFDLQLAISTAEEDNLKAEELSFMFQTAGPHMDFGFSKLILADIARLRKLPQLAKKIEEYEPQPDPVTQAKAEKEIELLDAQIAKEKALANKHNAEAEAAGGRGAKDTAQADLNYAKANEATAKAKDYSATADNKNLDYLQKNDGTNHLQELEKIDKKDSNQFAIELAKQRAAKKDNKTSE